MEITVNDVDFEFCEITARNGCDTFWLAKTHTTEAQWCAVMGGEFVNGANFPKVGVSLNDCEEYLAKLNKLTGGKFGLPSEFEYCAALGKEPENLEDYAVFGQGRIAEVGTKLPDENGVYDLRGLVWHRLAPEIKTNGKPRKYHALRGGSWVLNRSFARAVFRDFNPPAGRNVNVGFRVLCCRPLSSLQETDWTADISGDSGNVCLMAQPGVADRR